MTGRVTCEKWHDGSYWSASLPAGWRFRPDRSVRGFPHVFESPANSRVQIGTSRDVEVHGPPEAEPEGLSPEQSKTYRSTVSAARIDHWWTWRSYPRILFPLFRARAIARVYFAANDPAFAADSETALLILASIRFHAA